MKIQDMLGKVAPWIAAAAAGPAGLAGMAIKTAVEALGAKGDTMDDLAAAVAGASPEQLKALKLADLDFKLRMQELGYKSVTELEAIAANDRKDARAMQVATRSWVPATLTFVLLVAFNVALAALFFAAVPEGNRDIVVYMIGQLSGFSAAAVAYWLGTTRDSQNKTSIIAQAQPVKA
jgi:hypothetical protein